MTRFSHPLKTTGAVLCVTLWFLAPLSAEDKREQIGEVLGKPVYRDQIKVTREEGLTVVLNRLFADPVRDKYAEDHKKELEPTKEEIEKAQAHWSAHSQRKMSEEEPEQFARYKELKKLLQRQDLDPKERAKWSAEFARLELDAEVSRGVVEFWVPVRKWDIHIFENFGRGRVEITKFGMFAFDAHRAWLESEEKKGSFKITDKSLRDSLYQKWTKGRLPKWRLIDENDEGYKDYLKPDVYPPSLHVKK